MSYVGEDLIIKEVNSNLLVYYLTKYSNGRNKSHKFQPTKLLVPKEITFNNELVENLGMYRGDGQNSINSKSYQTTKFSNSNPILIIKFISFLNYFFNITVSELKAYITISKLFKPNKGEDIAVFEQNLILKWSNKSGILHLIL